MSRTNHHNVSKREKLLKYPGEYKGFYAVSGIGNAARKSMTRRLRHAERAIGRKLCDNMGE